MKSIGHSSRKVCGTLVIVAAFVSSQRSSFAAGRPLTAPDTVRLIVKSRAVLADVTRDRLLAGAGARRRAQISQINATVVEFPRAALQRVTTALRTSGVFSSVEEDAVAAATEIPNDPLFSSQWGALQINSPEAWNISTGSPDILIAVVDTGVDATHPDLQGQLVPGHDFVNDDDDPSDDNGHGTAMTGIVAAKANNLLGPAGIASGSKVLPVKVLDANGMGLYSTIAAGIVYAVDQGARVINLSLAGPSSSAALQSAVDYAHAHETVVVAAAGNSGQDTPMYPAALDGVVAVAATDHNERSAYFSNFGAWISLSAPGVDIMTTARGAGYGECSGTSPATAVVSAAFALLLAANPTMTAPQAIDRMTANAADLGVTGWDPYFGYGRVDTYAALQPGQIVRRNLDTMPPVVSIFSPSKESLVYGIVPIDVHANDNIGVVRVYLEIDRQPYASATSYPYEFAWDTNGVTPGAHKIRAFAYDANGNAARTAEVRVYVTSGVGLLVRGVSLGPNRRTGTDALSISGLFAFPSAVVLDPAAEAVSLDVTSAYGTVLSITIPAGSLVRNHRRGLQYTGPSAIPGDDVTVNIAKKTLGNGYSLKISDANATLPNVDSRLNLQVVVGTQAVAQSVVLRSSRKKLMLP